MDKDSTHWHRHVRSDAVYQVRRRLHHAPDTVFVEGVELVFDELRQVGAGSVFGLGEEGCDALLHQAGQRGLFRAVARAMDPGAIRRPLGQLHRSLDVRLPKC